MILSGVTTRVGLHAVMPKKHTIFSPLSESLRFSACLFKTPPPKYLGGGVLLWLVSSHMPEPAQLTTTEQLR